VSLAGILVACGKVILFGEASSGASQLPANPRVWRAAGGPDGDRGITHV